MSIRQKKLKNRKRVMKRIRRWRDAAYIKQDGRCYWCKRFMHQNDNMQSDQTLRCTADHVVPLHFGGKADDETNIVAACSYCNSNRYKWKSGVGSIRISSLPV